MRLEDQIQSAVVGYIQAVAPTVILYAIPNSARRTRGGRAANAVPGLRRGVFDLGLVLPDGRAAFVEVKMPSPMSRLSDHQRTFRLLLTARGIPYAVCRSVEDVRAALAQWGVETREHG